MLKTIVKAIDYENSDSIELQGTEEDVQKYFKKGYTVHIQRNGYWVLVKPSKVKVTLSKGKHTGVFDMREDVLDLYTRQRVNKKLCQRFKEDVNAGKVKIIFEPSSEEQYSLLLKRA